MQIFLHICCSQCYAKAVAGLTKEFTTGITIQPYWYNPNIHPLIEYRRRLKSSYMVCQRRKEKLLVDDYYGIKEFCRKTAKNQDVPERCRICYQIRLDKTAAKAKEEGCEFFATTLTTSLHQSHKLITTAAETAAQKHGIKFLYRDWREDIADEKLLKGIYKQQYCGCIFSEYDRYKDTRKHLYKGEI